MGRPASEIPALLLKTSGFSKISCAVSNAVAIEVWEVALMVTGSTKCPAASRGRLLLQHFRHCGSREGCGSSDLLG